MNAMEFFCLSAGKWRSQRTTHHLPFRQTELGNLEIEAEALAVDDAKVIHICELHQIDPELSVGGAFVSWQGSMAWDKEDESHAGTTVFALVPDADNPGQGQLLRERGYAEIVPVIGRYLIDNNNGFVLTTEYETMSSIERFWFASPDVRLRTSTVKRFGGFSTASFCVETRIGSAQANLSSSSSASQPVDDSTTPRQFYTLWGW